MRWRLFVLGFGSVLAAACPVRPQVQSSSTPAQQNELRPSESTLVDEVRFVGLRRVSPAAVATQLTTHAGMRLDPAILAGDVHALARFGWFKTIQVEQTASIASANSSKSPKHVALLFLLEEWPVLAKIEYSGSHLLSSRQIQKLLEEEKISPSLGRPMDPVVLHRIASAIRSSLNQLGHPQPEVRIESTTSPNSTLTVQFQIQDGPHLPVRRVQFTGHPQLSDKLLRAQMQSIAPWKPLAELRGKNAYTKEAFDEDRQRLLNYYQDHGYPEARISGASLSSMSGRPWKLYPVPHRPSQSGLVLSIPIEAGPSYRLESIETSDTLARAVAPLRRQILSTPTSAQSRSFSLKEVDTLRRFYSARLYANTSSSDSASLQSVVANPLFDSDSHSVQLKLALSDSPPYLVHRLEFQGLHRFSDRYVRRRIPLREGRPVDDRALEAGLARLARTGYFKPIRKENIRIQLDEARHTADIQIHLEEIGRQRTTFSGGHAQFGNSLGLAYTVFDLFNHEELLSAKLDAGPETLQLALGLAKEGIFGTRGSLAFSIFNNVLRPRLAKGVQGPFFNSRSEGISLPYTYSLTSTDSLGIDYTLSRTTTDLPLGTPPGLNGLPPLDLQTKVFSSSLGTAFTHDTASQRMRFSDSASGGLLGGDEHMLRASGEAARIFRDPLFSPSNSWAFRSTFYGAGSYKGDMPLYARFFSGDEFVRGLRDGELGPYAMTEKTLPSAATISSPSSAGANLLAAANVEYRISLHNGAEAVGFFDLGSGWLLPNWLGPTKPALLSATNGVLHGSTGLELRWTIPGIQVPLRTYYALNLLRLDRRFPLSGKSSFFVRNRFSGFGWGLGSLF